MVYLPDLDWSDAETKQTVEFLGLLKPDVVVSLSPCPFAEQIRNLPHKPTVLDQTLRETQGVKCGVPSIPQSTYTDTSTLHAGTSSNKNHPSLVWLSTAENKLLYNGPRDDAYQNHEQHSLALQQVREQFAKRDGEIVFLIDPSSPIPHENTWFLPRHNVRYEQTETAITGFACIRPDTLQSEIPAIDGIAARVPLLHRIHSGPSGLEWNVLPIDGGPAIQDATYFQNMEKDTLIFPKTKWLKAPTKSTPEVPLWMDDYVNNNPALGTGDTIQRGAMTRRFGWHEFGPSRDPFRLLHANQNIELNPELKLPELPRGAVRSPSNLFHITVGQLDEKGRHSGEGDDGINIYLDDRRDGKSHLLYFQGLYGAWPGTATWLTDRYVITAGTAAPVDEWTDETGHNRSTKAPTSIYLFDLQTGKSFSTDSYADTKDQVSSVTEQIHFPDPSSYETQERWKFLWSKIEAGYRIKPEPAPVSIDTAVTTAKLPTGKDLKWKDLGIWPSPETWKLASGKPDETYSAYPRPELKKSSDPLLTYTEPTQGKRHYQLAICDTDSIYFDPEITPKSITAHADLFTTGDGHLRQLHTIERIGEQKELLLLAGTYSKPNNEKGNWMLLLNSKSHRAWSAHW